MTFAVGPWLFGQQPHGPDHPVAGEQGHKYTAPRHNELIAVQEEKKDIDDKNNIRLGGSKERRDLSQADLLSLARLVREVTGADVPIEVAEEGMGPEYTGDNARLRAELPGIRFTPPAEAIAALREHYAARLETIDAEELQADR